MAQTNDDVLKEAKTRLTRAVNWEADFRMKFLEDLKFRNGDPDNMWQWPDQTQKARTDSGKPCLTINLIRQHNLQIINDAKQNKSRIRIRPTGGGATKEAADVWNLLVRKIEYQSNSDAIYYHAMQNQVDGGIGWWRIRTDYVDDRSFDQEIYLEPVRDPLSVYVDVDCHEKDKSDADWAFVFVPMETEELKAAYGEDISTAAGDLAVPQPAGATIEGFTVVCEYFRRVEVRDTLWSFLDTQGERQTLLQSEMPKEVLADLKADSTALQRPVFKKQVEWKLIVGNKIVDEVIWPGSRIPLIPVVGEETAIGGTVDRKGHTRNMKDAQRMFNYNASAQVEFVGQKSKTPWITAKESIEGLQDYWNSANASNWPYLPYNAFDEHGTPIPPPQPTQPPVHAPAYEQGMQTAHTQIMMASGQWQNAMGQQGNERTGKAIGLRMHQADTAVFHFQDNFEAALKSTGRHILELIPLVYTTKRVFQLKMENGEDFTVEVDPGAAQVYQQKLDADARVIGAIINPQKGSYEVESSVGPAYGTQREETQELLGTVLAQNPGLMGLIGDLLLGVMDFPEAQEAALRLKRMIPPQALGKGPTQSEQALQAQVQALQQALSEALDDAAANKLKLTGKAQARDIQAYEAQTQRVTGLLKIVADLDKQGKATALQLALQESQKAQDDNLDPISAANKEAVEQQSPDEGDTGAEGETEGGAPGGPQYPSYIRHLHPDARPGPGGYLYLRDPTAKGKFLRIEPLAMMKKPEEPRF